MPRRDGLGIVLALAWLWVGCGSDTPGGTGIQSPGPEANPVALVLVTAPDTVVEVGDSIQLAATALDSAGTRLDGPTFEWASDDASVATVSGTGLVTALSEGSVAISATAEGTTGSFRLTVAPVPPEGPVTIGLEEVAGGLDFPLYLTAPPDDPRLFIVERGGTIRIVKDGALFPTPFLDLTSSVSTQPEQGLLGLAFPADYATSGRLVVHYTDLEGDTRVSTFRVSGDPDRADPSSEGTQFGWSVMEGRHCMHDGCDQAGLTPPLLEYDHDEGCAVTGGYVYRGTAIPRLQGQYFFADFCGGWVHSITASGDGNDEVDWPTLRTGAGIPSFGEDAAGEIYVLSSDGRVFRIVPG